jgi:biopolymer transport protein ExbD
MTPMIDVVFQLLIFFVCTTRFNQQEQSLLATPRPPASKGVGAPQPPTPPELEDVREIEIRVARRDGRTEWLVNGDPCATVTEVERRLAALGRIRKFKALVPVILDVQDDVPLADAVDVYDVALRLDYEKGQFVTPEEPAK